MPLESKAYFAQNRKDNLFRNYNRRRLCTKMVVTFVKRTFWCRNKSTKNGDVKKSFAWHWLTVCALAMKSHFEFFKMSEFQVTKNHNSLSTSLFPKPSEKTSYETTNTVYMKDHHRALDQAQLCSCLHVVIFSLASLVTENCYRFIKHEEAAQ